MALFLVEPLQSLVPIVQAEAERGVHEDDTVKGKFRDAIVCAIFEALYLLHERKGSLKNFEELLTVTRYVFCCKANPY